MVLVTEGVRGSMRENRIRVTDLLFLMQVRAQSGGYTFDVELYSYVNPTKASDGRGGDCCDEGAAPPRCTENCENYFILCLRSFGTDINSLECPLAFMTTGVVGGDNLSFTVGQPFSSGDDNPVELAVNDSYPVSLH